MKRLSLVALIAALIIGQVPALYAQDANRGRTLNFPYYDEDSQENTGCGSGNLVGNDNIERAFHFFVSRGYQAFQSAGIVGNMIYESGVLPMRLQNKPADVETPAETLSQSQLTDGKLGWGIVQFTPPGKFINTQSPVSNANDLAVQLEFVYQQLEGGTAIPEKRAGDQLKQTTTVEEAVLAFQGNRSAGGPYVGYERPADQTGTVNKRTDFARDVLAQYGSGPSSGGSGCVVDAGSCPSQPVDQSQTVEAGGIRVHQCIAAEVERIMNLATAEGIDLAGGGWVSKEMQEQKRINNNCDGRVYDASCKGSPPTAVPGKSRHEFGTAIDFTCGGSIIGTRSSPCYKFLEANTKLINLESEPWHWSVDGK